MFILAITYQICFQKSSPLIASESMQGVMSLYIFKNAHSQKEHSFE